jgi:hypothetical protein
VTDAEGIPLVVRTGPANRPDAELALEMLDAIPPCGGQKGRPRRRPKAFQGDGAYGIKAIIAAVVQRRVGSLLAPYGMARKGARQRVGQDPLRGRAVAQLDGQLSPAEALLRAVR